LARRLRLVDEGGSQDRLLEQVAADVTETAPLTGRSLLSERVSGALRRVPRDRFVPPERHSSAWTNVALPIGLGQTISQPFIVAIMTELLDLTPDARVLEVGTGSGYQTAMLAELAAEVHTIELLDALAARARTVLGQAGYRNIRFRTGNGAAGWPEAAPFDAIIVTAAAASIPDALRRQLRAPGRMVIPVGRPGLEQSLILVSKDERGTVSERAALPVIFVPLIDRGSEESE